MPITILALQLALILLAEVLQVLPFVFCFPGVVNYELIDAHAHHVEARGKWPVDEAVDVFHFDRLYELIQPVKPLARLDYEIAVVVVGFVHQVVHVVDVDGVCVLRVFEDYCGAAKALWYGIVVFLAFDDALAQIMHGVEIRHVVEF